MQLTELELQNLRELISKHETACNKLKAYGEQAQDQQIKQMFQNQHRMLTIQNKN